MAGLCLFGKETKVARSYEVTDVVSQPVNVKVLIYLVISVLDALVKTLPRTMSQHQGAENQIIWQNYSLGHDRLGWEAQYTNDLIRRQHQLFAHGIEMTGSL